MKKSFDEKELEHAIYHFSREFEDAQLVKDALRSNIAVYEELQDLFHFTEITINNEESFKNIMDSVKSNNLDK